MIGRGLWREPHSAPCPDHWIGASDKSFFGRFSNFIEQATVLEAFGRRGRFVRGIYPRQHTLVSRRAFKTGKHRRRHPAKSWVAVKTMIEIINGLMTRNFRAHEALRELVDHLRRGCEFDISSSDRDGETHITIESAAGTLCMSGHAREMLPLRGVADRYMRVDWDALHQAFQVFGPAEEEIERNIIDYGLISLVEGMGITSAPLAASLLHKFTARELVCFARLAVATGDSFSGAITKFEGVLTTLVGMEQDRFGRFVMERQMTPPL